MTITGGSSLPKDDIERMVREAEEHAAEDKARRESAEIRNSAEQLAYSIEKLIKENDDKLPADVKTEVQGDVDALKTRARRRRRRGRQDRVRQAQREPDQARRGDLRSPAGRDRRRRPAATDGDRRPTTRQATRTSSTPRSSTTRTEEVTIGEEVAMRTSTDPTRADDPKSQRPSGKIDPRDRAEPAPSAAAAVR